LFFQKIWCLAFPGHLPEPKANKAVLGFIGIQAISFLVMMLTPWSPIDEWPCSANTLAAAEAALSEQSDWNCQVEDKWACYTSEAEALYSQHVCSENGICVYSEPKVCVTPINSPLLHRVATGFYLYSWPVYVGIVAFLFRRRTTWKGGRLLAIGTVVMMLLQQILDQIGLNQLSFGCFADAEWAGLECNDADEAFHITMSISGIMSVVLLLIFARIALWDSFVSYRRQQPIRSSAAYVLALSVLTIFFPVS
jgi:hypothetical protein